MNGTNLFHYGQITFILISKRLHILHIINCRFELNNMIRQFMNFYQVSYFLIIFTKNYDDKTEFETIKFCISISKTFIVNLFLNICYKLCNMNIL